MKNIVILENELQARDFAGKAQSYRKNYQVIATSPFASFELEEKGVSFKLIEDYYSPDELYKLGFGSWDQVEKVCKIIDQQIKKTCQIFSEIDFTPALYHYYSLVILYQSLSIRAFQLAKLIEHENPDMITVYGEMDTRSVGDRYDPLLFASNEKIYSKLLRLPGWDPVISFLPGVPLPEHPVKEHQRKMTRLRVIIYKLIGSRGLVLKKKYHKWMSYLMYTVLPEKYIYVLGGGFDWSNILGNLKEHGIVILEYRHYHHQRRWFRKNSGQEIAVKEFANAWVELENNNNFENLFRYGKTNFFPLLKGRLRFLVENITPMVFGAYKEALTTIKERNIKALLLTYKHSGFDFAISKAAQESNIPVVTWQQGGDGHKKTKHLLQNMELRGTDVHFVFGDGVAKSTAKAAKHFNTQLIPVGSESLNLLCKKLKRQTRAIKGRDKKVVFLPLGRYSQNYLYITSPPPHSDNYLFKDQREILNILCKHKEYDVIAKFHPIHGIPSLKKYTDNRGGENIRFLRYEQRFVDILPFVDIVVLDSPSTVLFHTLTTNKPCFLYPRYFLEEEVLELLKRRVYCYESLGELTEALDEYLSGKSIREKVDLEDKEFLRAYGIHEGNCGKKAAELLENIIHDFNGSRK
jgi:hypothetical protein